MPYHAPALLPPTWEECVAAALEAAEVGGAPVVCPTLTVWVRVVQLLDGRLHREPARAELAGGLQGGSAEDRRRWADAHRRAEERVMTTLWAGGRSCGPWRRRPAAVSWCIATPGRTAPGW